MKGLKGPEGRLRVKECVHHPSGDFSTCRKENSTYNLRMKIYEKDAEVFVFMYANAGVKLHLTKILIPINISCPILLCKARPS